GLLGIGLFLIFISISPKLPSALMICILLSISGFTFTNVFVDSTPIPAKDNINATLTFLGNLSIASAALPSNKTSSLLVFSLPKDKGDLTVVMLTFLKPPNEFAACKRSNPPIAPEGKYIYLLLSNAILVISWTKSLSFNAPTLPTIISLLFFKISLVYCFAVSTVATSITKSIDECINSSKFVKKLMLYVFSIFFLRDSLRLNIDIICPSILFSTLIICNRYNAKFPFPISPIFI